MDLAAEKGIILAALKEPGDIQDMFEQGVCPDSFANGIYKEVWQAVSKIILLGKQVDEFVLASSLGSKWGEAEKLWDESRKAKVDWQALIPSLKSHQALRGIDNVWAQYNQWKAKDPQSVRHFLPTLVHMLTSIAQGTQVIDPRPGKIYLQAQYRGEPLSTGLNALDNALHGGYRPTEMYVFGAPSGHGKTAMAASLAAYAVSQGIPTLIFSLEMDHFFMLCRVLCALAPATWAEAVSGKGFSEESDNGLKDALKEADEWLRIYPPQIRSPEEIDARIAWHMNEFGAVGLVLVDHIGLIRGGDIRTNKLNAAGYIGEMVYGLKDCALKHKTTVITFSQLSEEQAAAFKSKRDLNHVTYKGSGDIYNAADFGFIFMRDPDKVNMGFFRKKKDRMKGETSKFEIPHLPQYYLFCNEG